MAVSIFQRKRDLVYLVFFLIHLPVMLGKPSPFCVFLEAHGILVQHHHGTLVKKGLLLV
jgi:hypothetical protein